MVRHNNILVPIDFSEQSNESLRRAGVLAKQFNATVNLLHLIDSAPPVSLDMGSIPTLGDSDGMGNLIREANELNQLTQLADTCDFETALHIKTCAGSHARDICTFANNLPADLIVIGRHDEKNVLKHMFVGATVERVVAHANCSVLVIMPHDLFDTGDQ